MRFGVTRDRDRSVKTATGKNTRKKNPNAKTKEPPMILSAPTSPTTLAPASPRDRRPWKSSSPIPRPVRPVSVPARDLSGPSLFECLRGMDLFSHLGDADLLTLAASARERRADKGDLLLCQDDPEGKHLLVLLEGEAVVTRESVEGEEALLATLGPGDMAGEIAIFDAQPQHASVRAVTAVRVLALRREDLLRGLRERPELALDFLCGMARRLRLCGRRIAGICNHRAPRRVASALHALMEERGIRLKDESGRRCLLLRNRPTQRCIAELAGTTRETVSRFLAQWERAGWLSDAHGDLMILDESWLQRLAGEE